MDNKSSSITLGIVLVIIGLGLLLNKMHILEFSWSQIYPLAILTFSAFSFASLVRGEKNAAFLATASAVIGLFFTLRNYDIVDYLWYLEVWPLLLLSLGLGFVVLYVFKPYDWGILIPGSVLTFLGMVFLMENLDIAWSTLRLVKNLWPLVLVVIGAGLIANTLLKKRE